MNLIFLIVLRVDNTRCSNLSGNRVRNTWVLVWRSGRVRSFSNVLLESRVKRHHTFFRFTLHISYIGMNFPHEVAAVCEFSAIVQTRRNQRGEFDRRARRVSIVSVFLNELFTRRHFVRARPRLPPYCDPRLVLAVSRPVLGEKYLSLPCHVLSCFHSLLFLRQVVLIFSIIAYICI